MLTDVIRLLLFPALMAFAASSDLLTMTISNRLSLALTGGFFLLTIVTGMSLAAIGMHLAAGALVLTISFGFFLQGWIGGGRANAGFHPVPAPATAGRARPPELDSPPA